MIEEILNDLERKLNIEIDEDSIKYYTDGATESKVFKIMAVVNNKERLYIVKTVDDLTLKSQIEFLKFYNNIEQFQSVIFYNKDLKYICFEFIEGTKLSSALNIDNMDIIKQIKQIVEKYKSYEDDTYGYIYDNENMSWIDFLKEEIRYAMPKVKDSDLPFDILDKSIKIISKYKIDKYLIHGDFGAHNFLINNSNKLMVIDPMPVIGDPMYDFYFAVLSSPKIFKKIEDNELLKYFDKPYEYKISLYIIVLFIRLSRAYVYDRENLETYVKRFKKIAKINI